MLPPLPHSWVALPLMIKTTQAALESVDKNLINASYTLGHSELETALRVTLPWQKGGYSQEPSFPLHERWGIRCHLDDCRKHPGENPTPCLFPSMLMQAVVTGPKPMGWSFFFSLMSGLFSLYRQSVHKEDHLMGLSVRLLKMVKGFTLDVEWEIGDELAILFGESGSESR